MARRRSGAVSPRARIKLRRILQHTETDMRPTMERIGEMILQDMKANAPKDTGELANALTSFVSKNGLRVEIGLRGKKTRSRLFYARFIEFGTKGGEAKLNPRRGRAVLTDGDSFFGAAAVIPPMPARPFMQPAYDANKDEIRKMINDMVEKALEKAQQ